MKYFVLLITFSFLLFGCTSDTNSDMQENEIELASLTTSEVTNITTTSVTVEGVISNNGGATIIERGIVWGNAVNPTVNNDKKVSGSNTDKFSTIINNLQANSTYYLRAYAINSAGVSYGNVVSFKTLEEVELSIATLTTLNVEEITESSSIVGGQITSDGGSEVTERGVVWGNTSNPTLENNKTISTTNDDTFSFVITDLQPNSIYYIRAYAINSEGVAYGNELNFKTLEQVFVEKVYEGDVILTSQENIDSFGLNNYTEITGDVRMGGSLDITDLVPLKSINKIGKDLIISNADNLSSLAGLENLKSVGDVFQLISNDLLSDVSALANLNVNTSVIVIGNNNIEVLSGFSETTSLTSLVWIDDNASLAEISGLNNLEAIGGNLQITKNPLLTDIRGFSKLKSITGIQAELWLNNNEALTDITPLNSLEIVKDIVINGNASISDISIFNNIINLSSIEIGNNRLLTSISGFESLERVNGIYIEANVLLNSITTFANLSPNGTDVVRLRYNYTLQDFCSFNSLITPEYVGTFTTSANAYNPTLQDMLDGNCKP